MADIQDYISGKIIHDANLALKSLKFLRIPYLGSHIRKKLSARANDFEAKIISQESASEVIINADRCAIGERMCRNSNKNEILTESVYLNKLADGLVSTSRARYVSKEEAIDLFGKYKKYPIILSKVSGNYIEMCNSYPKRCVYWNLEKHGIKCLTK